jgi:predicted transcriptional regulator
MGVEDSGITPVEMDVLQCVADNQPATVRQVADEMAERRGIARTTVLTHMERLRKKRLLTRREINGINHYSTTRPTQDLLRGVVAEFVDRALGGRLTPFVDYLVERANLSREEADRLERMVEEIERTRTEATEATEKTPEEDTR